MVTLQQGDCLELLRDLPAGSVDMVFADLPYGVTANKWDTVIPFAPLWEQFLRVGKRNCAYVFTATQPFTSALVHSQKRLFKYELIWEKENGTGFLNAKKQPLRCHESILVFYRGQPTYCAQKTPGKPYICKQGGGTANYGAVRNHYVTESKGGRHPLSIVRVSRDKGKVHPTQKPVALLEWLIRTYTNPSDTVLDPTMGSGTTGVACANTGRNFHGIELDPTYFAMAQRRIHPPEATLAS